MTVLLTIDFDYFVPESPQFDWGHRESELFINLMWHVRAASLLARGGDPRTLVSMTGEEDTFWPKVEKVFDLSRLTYVSTSESHLEAYKLALLYGVDRVYSFDAHSDAWPTKETVDCGNWLSTLVESHDVESTVLLPRHAEQPVGRALSGVMIFPSNVFLRKHREKKSNRIRVDYFHICRSGAWVPPWLDEQFSQFVSLLPRRLVARDVGSYSTLPREWVWANLLKSAEEERAGWTQLEKEHFARLEAAKREG